MGFAEYAAEIAVRVWDWLMTNLLPVNLVLSIVIVFFRRRDPRAVWTWLLALYFIPVFGFLVTTMGFIAGSTLILGDHSRGLPRLARTAIAFAIGFSLLVWAGFTLLLNVPVPEGMFL